jgi:hypothetical protein
MKYPTGHRISENVYQSLRFVAKVGVMTRTTWYELFGSGSLRWKQKQLQHLIELGLFKLHPCTYVQDVVVIGELGKKIMQDLQRNYVPSISAQFIEHDETVGRGLWRLEQANICDKWITDKELKMLDSKTFQLNVKGTGDKFPDAVFSLTSQVGRKMLALEYEKTAKNYWRNNKAIMAYSDASNFNYILYVVESDRIETAVKRAMAFIGDYTLNSKIGFINVNDWKRDPITAPMRGKLDIANLGGLMQKVA